MILNKLYVKFLRLKKELNANERVVRLKIIRLLPLIMVLVSSGIAERR